MNHALRRKTRWSKLALAALFFSLGGYALYQAKDLIRGPKLTIAAPRLGETSSIRLIEVEGRAERIARLFLNGRLIFTDEAGRFEEKLLLPPGYTIINLEADDKFGRKVKTALPIAYQPDL